MTAWCRCWCCAFACFLFEETARRTALSAEIPFCTAMKNAILPEESSVQGGQPLRKRLTGNHFFDSLNCLSRALLIFNESKADIFVAVVSEAYARLNGHMPFRNETF